MEKQFIINKFTNEDDNFLVSKILDKIQYTIQYNKITTTNFLNLSEQNTVQAMMNYIKINTYVFFGAYPKSERKLAFFYPEKFNHAIVESNFKNFISVIRITLPKDLHSKYSHKQYLGGLMKLGIEREKIGDILVFNNGADIIISKDISTYILDNLHTLTRFKSSDFELLDYTNIRGPNFKYEELKIIIPSLRLDTIIAALIHVSRNEACKLIVSEKIFVNFQLQSKSTKLIKENDIITIRGKGRFNIVQILGNTKKGNIIVKILKAN